MLVVLQRYHMYPEFPRGFPVWQKCNVSKHAFQMHSPNAETGEEGSGSSSSNKTPGVYFKDCLEETSTIGYLEMRLKELKREGKSIRPEST